MSKQTNDKKVSPENGMFTIFFERLFRGLQFLPFQLFIGNRVNSTKKNENFHTLSEEQKKIKSLPRVRKIDIYILAFIIFEIISTFVTFTNCFQNHYIKWTIVGIATLRIIDITQINANITLFDILRITEEKNYTASSVRMIVNIIINFFELILCFGLIYCAFLYMLIDAKTAYSAYYFSTLTQVTLGFDKATPQGWLKLVVTSQLLISYFFSLLLLGRFIGLLPDLKIVAKNK